MNKNIIKFGICLFVVAGIAVSERYISRNVNSFIVFWLFGAAAIYGLVHNIRMLCVSWQLCREISKSKCKPVSAKIYKISGHSVHSADTTKNAFAKYNFCGSDYSGKMICTSDRKLQEGFSYTVFPCKKYPEYFALSEQHSKDALLTYAVFSFLLLLLIAGFAIISVLFIISEVG